MASVNLKLVVCGVEAAQIALAAVANTTLCAVIEYEHAIRMARIDLEAMRLGQMVSAEQVERALWWAGPNPQRLKTAHEFLCEGRTINENGGWHAAPQMMTEGDIREAFAALMRRE